MLILGIRQNEMIRLELPDGTQVKIRFVGSRIVFDLPDAVKVSREKIPAAPRKCFEDVL